MRIKMVCSWAVCDFNTSSPYRAESLRRSSVAWPSQRLGVGSLRSRASGWESMNIVKMWSVFHFHPKSYTDSIFQANHGSVPLLVFCLGLKLDSPRVAIQESHPKEYPKPSAIDTEKLSKTQELLIIPERKTMDLRCFVVCILQGMFAKRLLLYIVLFH